MNPLLPGNTGSLRSEFERRATQACPGAYRAERLSTLTLNIGLHCNLSCEVCYQRSSPSRTECMSREVMLDALHFASDVRPELIDVTGGEPMLWPHLREFVTLAAGIEARVRVWTNLDALLLPECADIPHLLAEHGVEVVASLPEALEGRTVGGCMEALGLLSQLGYGDPSIAGIPLDIAYNPLPGELPRPQAELAEEFWAALAPHGITFRELITSANVPLGGFAKWLDENAGRGRYQGMLEAAFDPDTLCDLPCRQGITIGWDGAMWDCDYNLAAHVALAEGPQNVGDHVGSQVGQMALATRRIAFREHCFACAARKGGATP
jgi:radical SAM/Cys-rich protein